MPRSWASFRWVRPRFSRIAFRPTARTSTFTDRMVAAKGRDHKEGGVGFQPPRPGPRHRIKSQLLYQLSYAGAPVIVFAESSSACRRRHGRPPALLSKLLSNPKTVVKRHDVETDKSRRPGPAAYRQIAPLA